MSELSRALSQCEEQLRQSQTLSQSQTLQIQQLQDVCTQLGGVKELNEVSRRCYFHFIYLVSKSPQSIEIILDVREVLCCSCVFVLIYVVVFIKSCLCVSLCLVVLTDGERTCERTGGRE